MIKALLIICFFVNANVKGIVKLHQCCKETWYDVASKTQEKGKKYLQVSTEEVYGTFGAEGFFIEITPINLHR